MESGPGLCPGQGRAGPAAVGGGRRAAMATGAGQGRYPGSERRGARARLVACAGPAPSRSSGGPRGVTCRAREKPEVAAVRAGAGAGAATVASAGARERGAQGPFHPPHR